MEKNGIISLFNQIDYLAHFILRFLLYVAIGFFLYISIACSIWRFGFGYRGDVLEGIFFGIFWPLDRTEYAKGYVESKFSLIYIGMPFDEVKKILGNPVQEWKSRDGEIYLEYSCYRSSADWCSPVDGYFHKRRIGFDREGKVFDIQREYWID